MDTYATIIHGTETVIGAEALQKSLQAGKKLKVKLGVDPTRPDLTFGHMVVLNKLRQFQELGHHAVLLIGDYTTTIGDPSGRSTTRPLLTRPEVLENAKTYLDQAFKVLDSSRTDVVYNSEWFSRLSFEDALMLSRKMTVARMLERDDFAKRFKHNIPISIVEFLYPLLQGYDSVRLQADVELGGTDQLFNMLVGRQLQKIEGQPEQAILCMPLLVGLDGTAKMSKSADNYISLQDTPNDMFGKIMSINDRVMLDYYALLLLKTPAEIEAIQQAHPLLAKKQLACSLVAQLHSPQAATQALEYFEHVFSRREVPPALLCLPIQALMGAPVASAIPLVDLLYATKAFASKKELKRLMDQGSVKVNGQICQDPQWLLDLGLASPEWIVQVGKRHFFKFVP